MSIVARLASRLGLLAFVAAGLVSVGPMNEAHAVYTTIGLTVICTGNTPGDFGDGSQDNLNITVQPAATVGSTGSPNPAIDINDNNILNNYGTLTADSGLPVVRINTGNTVTTYGTITVGDGAVGISSLGITNSIVNRGLIAVGADSVGISILDNSTATNFGTITVGASTGAPTFGMGIGGVVRLFAQFDGDFSDNAQSWSGTGGIRLYW